MWEKVWASLSLKKEDGSKSREEMQVELGYDQTWIGPGKDYLELIFIGPDGKASFHTRLRKENAPALLAAAQWLASRE